jgi:hypothetical protein
MVNRERCLEALVIILFFDYRIPSGRGGDKAEMDETSMMVKKDILIVGGYGTVGQRIGLISRPTRLAASSWLDEVASERPRLQPRSAMARVVGRSTLMTLCRLRRRSMESVSWSAASISLNHTCFVRRSRMD